MTRAVAEAVEARTSLVVEAGTGVGKTFAYLVPLLLNGRRALISTATKSLQDQLFLRDLPRLKAALAVPVRLALLKGRASYLCLHRLEQARHNAELPDRWAVKALARVEAWAMATRSGDLAEIEGLDDRSPVIPLVTSTRDNCLGSECPRFADCHVVRARREAMAADIVVINHHLFFADLVLRDSGVSELLPTVETVVFDEAHQLTDAGLQFLGTPLATGQILELCRDALAAGLQHARGLHPWQALSLGLETAVRELRLVCAGPVRDIRGIVKLRWQDRAALPAFDPALERLAQAATELGTALSSVEGTSPDFERLVWRAEQVLALCKRFAEPVATGRVRWIDLSAHGVRLMESPLDIREMLSGQRGQSSRTWIFTSATLGDDDALTWFVRGAGLEDARALRVGSPFDYANQARLWIPKAFPKPNDVQHARAVGALAARCAQALQGRCFVLTTTLRALPTIAEGLRASLAEAGLTMELLVQGSQPRRTLIQQFGDGRGRILLGSHSFWEGIDVPGDALQCVLIDKLPFPPPNDPLVEAKVQQIEERGGQPFQEYFVAEAAIALKQGGGRLIRRETDRGLLVICDPRMLHMPYGKRLRAALPPMPLLSHDEELMDWLRELTLAH